LRPPSKQAAWHIEGAREEHGFVFEVPADGVAEPEPIKAMGQFYHEAAAVDPDTGTVYMTEDASPKAGFYRYLPNQPGRLAAGGRLQMLAVERRRDLRDDLVVGEWMTTNWVDIDDPTRGFSPNSREGDGVVSQGIEAGGSWFDALEGCVFSAGRIWFTSKTGGNARSGYVFEYDPGAEAVRLIYESPGHGELSGPDNLVMSPRGSLVVCEDKTSWFKTGQRLAGLNADGRLTHFCGINPELDATHLGFDLRDTARKSEWAGACYSPDGQWMFVNIYNPGCTVAITGPWQPGSV
jgi:secreted PhoX family phosphatase